EVDLTFVVLADHYGALGGLGESEPDLLVGWHWLTTGEGGSVGFDALFTALRQSPRPTRQQAREAIRRRFDGEICRTHGEQLLEALESNNWPMAYAIAWLSVAGGNSVLSPWVRHQFPETNRIVQLLRDTACTAPGCGWCRTRHDARSELERWFGFPDFRP